MDYGAIWIDEWIYGDCGIDMKRWVIVTAFGRWRHPLFNRPTAPISIIDHTLRIHYRPNTSLSTYRHISPRVSNINRQLTTHKISTKSNSENHYLYNNVFIVLKRGFFFYVSWLWELAFLKNVFVEAIKVRYHE